MLTYPVAFLVSLIVAAIATPLVARWAHKNQWFDLPIEARKVHTRAIPRIGGIAVFIAFFAPLIGLAIYTNRISGLLYQDATMFTALCCGAGAILTLGIYDDLKGADAKTKLIVQAGIAAMMWSVGFRVDLLGNPFGPTIELGVLSLPLTMLWMIGIINALNLIDGLDGLASGIALFTSVVLFGVAFTDNAVLLCLLMAALGGSLVGFLFFNFNPARIFLGDSGSMFLGFVLAAVSVWTQRKGATAVALLIPVLALGVPILDTTLSFVRRVARKQNPFKADREHVHHRLLALGLSHKSAVLTLYTLSAVFGLGALALLDNDTTHRAIVLSTVAAAVFILVRKIGIFELPGIFKRKDDGVPMREQVRVTARLIRASHDPNLAWRHTVGFLSHLTCQEVRLSWHLASPDGELRESVFKWREQSDRPWLLSTGGAPENRTIRLPLEEAGRIFGELTILRRGPNETTLEQEITCELLRVALIDFCVANEERNEDTARIVQLPTGTRS